jgi:hypothetical protein
MTLFPNPTLDFVSLGVCTFCTALYSYITTWYWRMVNPTPAQTKTFRLVRGISVYGFPVYLLAVGLLWLVLFLL